ncbi:MAG: 3-oxoacyl-ACP reductase FabG [Armatimonadetes bacterium]|nr:3-oxoacyl-ACP reductase FabG [Armatimonadota bacterium]
MKQHSRIALVTGASQGVGRGIALGLAEDGWDVGLNYYENQAGAEATAEIIRAKGQRCWVLHADVGDAEQVQAMFRYFHQQAGGLDLLVNNAGVQTWASLLDLKESDWDRTIRTNLKGTFLCTQQAARLMKDTGGRIINIGSGANKAPFPNLIDYCASKGGIQTFTVVAAVELGRFGITVNSVAPGTIEIERTKLEDPNYAGAWGALTPVGRIGSVEDVTNAVVFLAGDKAGFITGQTLYVDGGLWSQVPWAYKR